MDFIYLVCRVVMFYWLFKNMFFYVGVMFMMGYVWCYDSVDLLIC